MLVVYEVEVTVVIVVLMGVGAMIVDVNGTFVDCEAVLVVVVVHSTLTGMPYARFETWPCDAPESDPVPLLYAGAWAPGINVTTTVDVEVTSVGTVDVTTGSVVSTVEVEVLVTVVVPVVIVQVEVVQSTEVVVENDEGVDLIVSLNDLVVEIVLVVI